MEIEDLDIEFPSFQASSSSSIMEAKPLPVEEVKPIQVVNLPNLNPRPVEVVKLPVVHKIIPPVTEQKNQTPKEVSYQKFNELNLLFATCLGWTFTKKDFPVMGIPPIGYGAPFTDIHNASRKREEIALPIYTKDISAIWDCFFFINKNHPTNFEFEILTNWDSMPNEKNPNEEFNFMTAHINIYFNKMRRFIYDVPLGQVPLAFCLLFSYANNGKTEHLESFFKLKVESFNVDKK